MKSYYSLKKEKKNVYCYCLHKADFWRNNCSRLNASLFKWIKNISVHALNWKVNSVNNVNAKQLYVNALSNFNNRKKQTGSNVRCIISKIKHIRQNNPSICTESFGNIFIWTKKYNFLLTKFPFCLIFCNSIKPFLKKYNTKSSKILFEFSLIL